MSSRRIDYPALTPNHYGFSATRIGDLGSAEYTLVSIAADRSGSVSSFLREIERCMRDVVLACQRSPRADNLMLRVTCFDAGLSELHGFKPLADCPPSELAGKLKAGGATALYDAALDAFDAVARYGKDLASHDLTVNALVFVLTDGMDNASRLPLGELRAAIARAMQGEGLESLLSVLVGVNVSDPQVSQYLQQLRSEAGFSQYVELEQASVGDLARLADFASRAISAQSRSLGTGRASPSLTF